MDFSKQKDPNAMDVDAMSTEQQAEAMKKGLCFGCGKQGHCNADCPDKKGKKKGEEKKKWTSKELKEHVWALFNSMDVLSYDFPGSFQNGKYAEDNSGQERTKSGCYL